MKIDKALEILTDFLGEGPQFSPDDRREAVQLGIEALKRIQDMRTSPCTTSDEILPGETDEADEARQYGAARRAEQEQAARRVNNPNR